MMNKEDITVLKGIITKNISLDTPSSTTMDEDELFKVIDQHISYLLDHEFEKLLQAMYRLDVDENKFRQAFAQPKEISKTVTQLIIDRVKQKIEFRKKYQ